MLTAHCIDILLPIHAVDLLKRLLLECSHVLEGLLCPHVSSHCLQGLKDTTKARDGFQRMPLMNGIGNAAFVDDVETHEVARAAAALGC
jgi:hypothetical protein